MMNARPARRDHRLAGRLRAGGAAGRALLHTLRDEAREGTLLATLSRSLRARGLAFAGEPGYAEVLERRAAAAPGAPFLTFEDQRLSAGELDARAAAAAAGLLAMGARPGDHVAIMSPNCPAFLEAFFATQKLGLAAVPVNTALVGDGLAYLLAHSRARFAIVHHAHVDVVLAVRDRAPELRHVVVITDDEAGVRVPRGLEPFERWRRAGLARPPRVTPPPGAVSLLLYTSGTTGAPKGVVTRYHASRAKRLRLLAHLLYRPDDVLYTCLPLFHANALILSTMQALLSGGRLALARRFRASTFWQDVARSGATTFNALGAMIPILLKQPPGPADRAHAVRLVVSAACPAAAWRPFEERFGVRIVEAYAAVDGGGFVTMNLGDGPPGSIGRPLGGARYRLVAGNGADAATGAPGELWVWAGDAAERRVEYYGDAEATRQKTPDGWIRTGDLLSRDAAGYLYFAGRNSDSMRRRGENVSAFEVESVLSQHPAVQECAVFGVPSELGEEDIMAVIVAVDGQRAEPAELRAFLDTRLARHALPRYLEVLDELPKTGTHRVQKGELRARGVTARTWDGDAGGRRAREEA